VLGSIAPAVPVLEFRSSVAPLSSAQKPSKKTKVVTAKPPKKDVLRLTPKAPVAQFTRTAQKRLGKPAKRSAPSSRAKVPVWDRT